MLHIVKWDRSLPIFLGLFAALFGQSSDKPFVDHADNTFLGKLYWDFLNDPKWISSDKELK